MQPFEPLRELRPESGFKKGDVLVVFGEVFARGYVNGLIDQAEKAGLKVIYSTVGRRDSENKLRPLTAEELASKEQPLINIPLECGFDLIPGKSGQTPVDQLKGLKLSEWDKAEMNFAEVEECRKVGREDFRKRVATYIRELESHIPKGANVLFAHTMAGGIPRAKIILPVMNRMFKGHGERFASSREFWDGVLGRFSAMSFLDVTANSFQDLIDQSEGLRARVEQGGGQVCYIAHGYHGTEILMGGEYKWQSYAPYLQGFAKLELEQIAIRSAKKGIQASVFNAPEILTNSSSVFLGVEVALYPLLGAFKKERPGHPLTKDLLNTCSKLLKPEHSLDEILKITDNYFTSDIIAGRWSNYEAWPQHNGPEQMELMRTTSDKILAMHADEKNLLTARLSEIVFKAFGKAVFQEALRPRKSVWWVGHDLVAKTDI